MFARLRSRLSYANVMATIAMFIALGGSSYAAVRVTSQNVPKDALTGADIKNLTGKDLKDESVTGKDVQGIRGADVVNGSLLAEDFGGALPAGTQGPQGPQGPEGPQGAQGPQGQAGGGAFIGAAAGGALTGTYPDPSIANESVTAAQLAANSVGSAEIQVDAVNATEIANDSIDSGEIVDFGLSNQDVGVLFAQVDADGTLANSSGSVTASSTGTGTYEVDFGRNISACAFVVTQGEAGLGGAPGAITGATDRAGNSEAVFVTMRTNANALADRAFHLVVVC
jgi:hypothetical protein